MKHTTKKIALLSLLMAVGTATFAQVKVGGTPGAADASALMQLGDAGGNKGFLNARVSLTTTTTWGLAGATPVAGMQVYNTNASITGATANGVGMYYWDGTQWVWIKGAVTAGTDWLLNGNTNGAIKTLGTNDNFDLPFETNNTEKMRLTTGGNLGIGVTAPTTSLDVNGSGLFRNGNTAAAYANNQLLFGFTASNQYQHAIKTRHNVGGSNGNSIDFYVWKQGTDAATTVGTQQVMTLDGANGGSVGVGTTTPTAKLEVNNGTTAGAIKIVDGTQGAGRVLTSDANGLATWGTLAPQAIVGTSPSGQTTYTNPGGTTVYTGNYVTIPAGRSTVTFNASIFTPGAGYLSICLSTSSTVSNVTGLSSIPYWASITVLDNIWSGGQVSWNVNNTSGAPMNVYVWMNNSNIQNPTGTIKINGSASGSTSITAAY